MSEYREVLQRLVDATHEIVTDSSLTAHNRYMASIDAAKALLARPEPVAVSKERLLATLDRLINEGDEESVEPAAAEKARERNIAIAICHAITDNCVMVDDPERTECTADNCAAMKALKGCSEPKSTPAATGETKRKCNHILDAATTLVRREDSSIFCTGCDLDYPSLEHALMATIVDRLIDRGAK